jgi:large subunit ribosomal protein L25
MNETTIKAQVRSTEERPRDIRESGLIPAVVYGFGLESTPIQFDYQEFRKAFRITGKSTVMTIDLDGKQISTLIADIQYNPLTDLYDHIDFLAVDDSAPVKTTIRIKFEGMSPAEKNLQSVISKPNTSIEVSCLPKLMQKEIIVDLGVLKNFFDKVTVADLAISSQEGVEVITPAEAVIVQASTPKGGIQDSKEEEL